MIIAGDIGGTKTHLALFDWKKDRIDPLRLESFHSADYTSLEDMLTEFLAPPTASTPVEELTTEKRDAVETEHQTEQPRNIDAASRTVIGLRWYSGRSHPGPATPKYRR